MAGVVVDLVGGADLHDVPGVHDGHPVGDVGHHPEVVGDEDHRQVIFDPQVFEQLQDLGLDGDVQGGGGLVADQDLGVAGHRDGDDHPLAHPARKLVRVLLEAALGVSDAHVPQVFHRLFPGGAALQVLVQLHRLGDLVADGLEGVQAGHGVLHDHGDLVPAHPQPVLFLFQAGQADGLAVVGPKVINGALGDGAVCVQQAHEGLGEHALARAAFAHDGQHFALLDVQVDAADGVQDPAPEVEADVDVPGREDGGCVFHLAASFTAYGSWGRRRPRRRCRSGRTRW